MPGRGRLFRGANKVRPPGGVLLRRGRGSRFGFFRGSLLLLLPPPPPPGVVFIFLFDFAGDDAPACGATRSLRVHRLTWPVIFLLKSLNCFASTCVSPHCRLTRLSPSCLCSPTTELTNLFLNGRQKLLPLLVAPFARGTEHGQLFHIDSSLLFTSTVMISGSVVVPFQKGPCGENGRWRGFLLCWLEAAAAVVLFLFLLICEVCASEIFSRLCESLKNLVNLISRLRPDL